ncbi:MAG TPA: 3-oxoadipate enol-lactonase [Thermodesulfobacteriota bacterium]|nr:3-oxoadipate enol-lactonase [Thermodesulfobacteriota bacterium]
MLMKANGIQMNYEISGKQEVQTVMLSHSLGSSLVMWHPQMDLLEPYFVVLRYDTRGHGRSEAPKGPYTLELFGEDVIGLLDALEIDKVHFVGLSMGGMIGQCLALNHPNRLHSLILCDTSSIVTKEGQPAIQERIDTARNRGMQALVGPTMERWFTPSFISKNPPGLGIIRKQFLATPVEGYIGCNEAIRKLNYRDQLSGIKLPTLILVGEDDPGTPVAAAQAIHERIKNSKLVIIPSARHLSNVEQPKVFNEALLGFLRSL